MSYTTFSKRRVRVAANVRSTEESRDIRTGSTISAFDSADFRLELALFDGAPSEDDTPFCSLADITQLRLVIVDEETLEGAAVVESVVDQADFTNTAMTRAQWDAGEPDQCHVAFDIDYTEMALLATGEKVKTFHFAIYGPADGGQDVYAHGKIVMVRSGATIGVSQYVGVSSRVDNGRPYFLSGDGLWYPLIVLSGGGYLQLAIDVNNPSAATSVTEVAVGPEWGIHNGQVHWYDGADWWPVERVFDGSGIMQVQMGLTALVGTPNGTLVGSTYSMKTGRVRARDTDLDHHWLQMSEDETTKQVQWSLQIVAG